DNFGFRRTKRLFLFVYTQGKEVQIEQGMRPMSVSRSKLLASVGRHSEEIFYLVAEELNVMRGHLARLVWRRTRHAHSKSPGRGHIPTSQRERLLWKTECIISIR
ncbi:hypothetical protein MPER_01925, partial [Moniliophthora perniciosa FA553]